jgi:hypothetical protein
MSQMPIQMLPGRADTYLGARTAQPVLKTGAPQPAAYLVDPGGISGGVLRPGAIDQEKFKRYLADAQKQSVTAPPIAAPSPPPGVPTLSPAQFAALGAVPEVAAGETPSGAAAANPAPIAADPYPFLHRRAQVPPAGPDVAAAAVASASPPAETPPTPPAETDAAPTVEKLGVQKLGAAPIAPAAPPSAAPASPAPAAQASAERGPVPGSHRGADGVWELPRLPDKDERDMLRGQKWRVVENPAARTLFLGPDGEFGWDDFVDLINPLQHIPLVNIAYRAITGDQIYGAARMVDFALGPLAGVSTAADLAFQSTTGHGLADNAVAALFGAGHEDASAIASVSTASDGGAQIADASATRHGSHQ